MGDAIARFRDMALAIRRICDERHSQPRGRAVEPAAAKKFAKACRDIFLGHEEAGMSHPARYVRGLCKQRDEAERHPDPPPPGHFDLPNYIEWLPEPFPRTEPADSEIREARRNAVKEALRWGSLFPVLEARIKALDAAAHMLLNFAAPECYEWPNEKYWKKSESGQTVIKAPSKHDADRDYIARHEEFAEALEALAPFIDETPAAISPPQHKDGGRSQKHRNRRGIGGRPEKFTMKFIREVVAARERDEKQIAKAKQPLPSFPRWLREYCDEHGINIRERFPPVTPGEEWSIRANRFWKAAKQRLSRVGN